MRLLSIGLELLTKSTLLWFHKERTVSLMHFFLGQKVTNYQGVRIYKARHFQSNFNFYKVQNINKLS